MKTFRSYSSAETAELGARFARKICDARDKADGATILALQGDLGAGKTTFTQGFARGLGIKRRTASPTFIIMRRFAIPAQRGRSGAGSGERAILKTALRFKNFYHVDAYRLKKLDSLEAIGLLDIFHNPANIVVVEWPDKIKNVLPRGARTIWLKFQYGKKENERIIRSSVLLSL